LRGEREYEKEGGDTSSNVCLRLEKGQEKRSGKERSRQWKLKMVGSHSCRRNIVHYRASSPPTPPPAQKKILRHRRVDAIFLTAFTSVPRGEGKAAASLQSQRIAQTTNRERFRFPDQTTTSQVNHQRVGPEGTVLYPRLQPYFTAICSLPQISDSRRRG
jgi:hypothetical protein